MSFPDLNIEALSRIYAVSNTPSYLVRNFKLDPTVQRIAQEVDRKELLDFVYTIDRERSTDLPNLVKAYAALVAATMRPDSAGLEVEPICNLQWAEEILEEAVGSSVSSSSFNFKFPPKVISPKVEGSLASNNIKDLR